MLKGLPDKELDGRLKFIWYVCACGVDSAFSYALYSKYVDIYELYEAEDYDMHDLKIPDDVLRKLYDKRLEDAFELFKKCVAMDIKFYSIEDKLYPQKLKKIKDPPLLLFFKGNFPDFDKTLCAGMVGTRNMSDYGKKTAEYLAGGIASCGVIVISGLAKGIDGTCQRAALNNGGFTVGVIGNSIDSIYPKENAALFNKVYKYGVVISEYWPGCATYKTSFPRRNRIIAGLSDFVVVVEAPDKSGALITASLAKRQGKLVCVPPMPLTKENAGTASLVRGGARMIMSVSDILEEYEVLLPHTIPPDLPLPSLLAAEKTEVGETKLHTRAEKEHAYNYLLDYLDEHGPVSLTQAAMDNARFSLKELMRVATELELDGYAVRLPGGLYDAVLGDKVPAARINENQT